MDNVQNFSYSTVKTAPSPSTTGTSLILQTGDGALFPSGTFNATIWPAGQLPLITNAEIARCTITGDTVTMARHQENSSAQPIAIGYQFAAGITANTIAQVLAACDPAGAAAAAVVTAEGFATAADVTVLATATAQDATVLSSAQTFATAAARAQWPVGSIHLRADATNPNTALGFGTWSLIAQGQALFGFKSSDPNFGSLLGTGGSLVALMAHTHTGPNHQHNGPTNNTDINHTHNFTTDGVGDHQHNLGGSGVFEGGFDFSLSAGSGSSRNAVTQGAGGHNHTGGTAGSNQENPSNHAHTFTTQLAGTGVSGPASISTTANSLPPYLTIMVWQRTA